MWAWLKAENIKSCYEYFWVVLSEHFLFEYAFGPHFYIYMSFNLSAVFSIMQVIFWKMLLVQFFFFFLFLSGKLLETQKSHSWDFVTCRLIMIVLSAMAFPLKSRTFLQCIAQPQGIKPILCVSSNLTVKLRSWFISFSIWVSGFQRFILNLFVVTLDLLNKEKLLRIIFMYDREKGTAMVSKLGKNSEFAEVNIGDGEALEANLQGLRYPSFFHTLNLKST